MIEQIARQVLDNAMSEREFQAQIIKLARLLGWRVFHPWLSVHSASGWPDLALCRPPRFLLAEIKRERADLTPAQVCWRLDLAECPGVEIYTWRPSDFEEITRVLG